MNILSENCKVNLIRFGVVTVVLGTLWLGNVDRVNGHGYVQIPASLSYMGYKDTSINWLIR